MRTFLYSLLGSLKICVFMWIPIWFCYENTFFKLLATSMAFLVGIIFYVLAIIVYFVNCPKKVKEKKLNKIAFYISNGIMIAGFNFLIGLLSMFYVSEGLSKGCYGFDCLANGLGYYVIGIGYATLPIALLILYGIYYFIKIVCNKK